MEKKYSFKILDEYGDVVYDYSDDVDSDDEFFDDEDEAMECAEDRLGAMRLGYEISSDFQDEDDNEYEIEIEEV